jgi:hypothetical protein
VDKPNDVFDTYGRLVGDIEVTINGKTVNINQWLVEHGWAFPTFYSSMSNDEIDVLMALAKTARSKKLPVWKNLTKTSAHSISTWSSQRRTSSVCLQRTQGRNFCPNCIVATRAWSARNKANVTSQSFQQYLAAGPGGKPDVCFETSDFLPTGCIRRRIAP